MKGDSPQVSPGVVKWEMGSGRKDETWMWAGPSGFGGWQHRRSRHLQAGAVRMLLTLSVLTLFIFSPHPRISFSLIFRMEGKEGERETNIEVREIH